jgi:hypothetical protein
MLAEAQIPTRLSWACIQLLPIAPALKHSGMRRAGTILQRTNPFFSQPKGKIGGLTGFQNDE